MVYSLLPLHKQKTVAPQGGLQIYFEGSPVIS